MRLTCPLCGSRDRREFYYYGAADYLNRPEPGAGDAAWDDYLHLRDNPAGVTRDLWYHELGCSAWILVERNTVTHEVLGTTLVADHQSRASSVARFVWQEGDLREIPSPASQPEGKARTGATQPRKPRVPRKGKGGPT